MTSLDRTVHVVVPEGIDDPTRPSGGNVYDRRVCDGLRALGWVVTEHPVPGAWPQPDPAALAALGAVLAGCPDDALVLVDGLVGSAAPEVLVPQADRLRLVALVHMSFGGGGEGAVLEAARAVVTTSGWTRQRLLDAYGLPAAKVCAADPGVDPAELATGTADGGRLLCVAAVTPGKGHDVLVDALAEIAEPAWTCRCVGSLDRDPAFAAAVRAQAAARGIADRVAFPGPRTGADLDAEYAAADVLVLTSRAETYGMVVAEALARGLPVVASQVGGLPDALGRAADGSRPGLLVAPDDPAALAAGLRTWLGHPGIRTRLRAAARGRRESLSGWVDTTARVADVLTAVAAG